MTNFPPRLTGAFCSSLLLALSSFTISCCAQQPVSYARDVRPFIARYCLECHNATTIKGGLNLETYQGMVEGGNNGPVLVRGKPEESRVVLLPEGKAKPAMPPKKAKQPKTGEARVLREWVAAGAKDDSLGKRV